jgi:hypothetical protein
MTFFYPHLRANGIEQISDAEYAIFASSAQPTKEQESQLDARIEAIKTKIKAHNIANMPETKQLQAATGPRVLRLNGHRIKKGLRAE